MKAALFALLCAAAAGAFAQGAPRPADELPQRIDRERSNANPNAKSEWEKQLDGREFQEAEVDLPAYPKDGALLEFKISRPGTIRFFIDAATLSVGADGVVRYTLVARSSGGVDNVSYEGLRCAAGLQRIYAYGNDGRWARTSGAWKASELRWIYELRTRYLCPLKMPVKDVAEALEAVRRGGHRDVTGIGGGSGSP